jgi:hypothetical protein
MSNTVAYLGSMIPELQFRNIQQDNDQIKYEFEFNSEEHVRLVYHS